MLLASLFFFLIPTLLTLKLPLSNLTDPLSNKTYHIQLDFGSKHTVLPFRTKSISLSSHSIQIRNLQTNYSSNIVKIGLQHPSDFIISLCKTFKIDQSEIQFSYKNSKQLQILISQVNLVERKEYIKRGDKIDYHVVYNYGKSIQVKQQTTKIIQGNKIFFNQYFILQILNSMSIDNRITYSRENDIIHLRGNLNNFPHIIALSDNNQIQLYIENPEILYINTASSANLIGILALKDYSKFQIVGGGLMLKRSSLSIVLYLFIGVYAVIMVGLIVNCWRETEYTMGFVRDLAKATFLKDDRARVNILMTELQ